MTPDDIKTLGEMLYGRFDQIGEMLAEIRSYLPATKPQPEHNAAPSMTLYATRVKANDRDLFDMDIRQLREEMVIMRNRINRLEDDMRELQQQTRA